MKIHLMAESKIFKDFNYPIAEGVFYGTLQGASWATHSILHTYWLLDNGEKIDCPLFRDTRPKNIEHLPDNIYARLTRLPHILCKPPIWCKMESPNWRFLYGKKKTHT